MLHLAERERERGDETICSYGHLNIVFYNVTTIIIIII